MNNISVSKSIYDLYVVYDFNIVSINIILYPQKFFPHICVEWVSFAEQDVEGSLSVKSGWILKI